MNNIDKPASEITKLEYALIHSTWMPSEDSISIQHTRDRNLNPHNDSYKPKLRSRNEIINHLRIQYFTEMLTINPTT